MEDEPEVRQLVQRALENRGYTILSAGDGGEGLAAFTKYRQRIDLVLTDVVMPVLSGPDMAARLAHIHPETRVLFMSGYTDREIMSHGMLRESVHLLQKPFAVSELARRVREVLDGPGAPPSVEDGRDASRAALGPSPEDRLVPTDGLDGWSLP